jgi:membrane-bound lytic murein transglycosylase B
MSRGRAGTRLVAVALAGMLAWSAGAPAQDYAWDPADVEARRSAFIERMVAEHGFDRDELASILSEAVVRQSALNAISRPAERVIPWFEYREIFLNEQRIDAGARFWADHAERVAATSERFGVDQKMILSILGIETLFGERMGTYRVIDALSTLAFAYPPRADFFASELESFLLIYEEEGPVVLDQLGSYAGAMGAGQFIPSSYRAYAVDADGDGRRDLWQNWDDILASIANYLAVHGWQLGEPVAVEASQGTAPGVEPGNRLGLDTTVGELRDRGFGFEAGLARDEAAMLVAVEGDPSATAYFVGLNNFHVITRYNRSVKYALAAVELSEAIEQRFREMQPGSEGDDETL